MACAEAGATLISPFVGRITDWFAAHEGRSCASPESDPGVLAVTAIYDYFKDPSTGLGRTEIMAASLRNAGQARPAARPAAQSSAAQQEHLRSARSLLRSAACCYFVGRCSS